MAPSCYCLWSCCIISFFGHEARWRSFEDSIHLIFLELELLKSLCLIFNVVVAFRLTIGQMLGLHVWFGHLFLLLLNLSSQFTDSGCLLIDGLFESQQQILLLLLLQLLLFSSVGQQMSPMIDSIPLLLC